MDAEQMKKLLELLEQALKCEQVATITITICYEEKTICNLTQHCNGSWIATDRSLC